MFKLAARRAAETGLNCGKNGLYLGTAVLIEPEAGGGYRVRPAAEIEMLVAAAYDTPPANRRLLDGVQRVAGHLRDGNIPLAMIAAVHLGLPDIEGDRIERLAHTDALLRANYKPDEPRDAQGRWTDGDGAGAGSSGRGDAPTSAGGTGPSASRAWENYSNPDFRNRLAIAEGSVKPNDSGYGEMLDRRDRNGRRLLAFGRYQMTPAALQAAGMMDRDGSWTGKYGIHSRAEFLADPDAQEKALSDYLADLDRQLRANGAYTHVGETIDGLKARFPVTRAGILAAAHREGAGATIDYLGRVKAHGLTSKGLSLKPQDRPIETRLRTFSGARYE